MALLTFGEFAKKHGFKLTDLYSMRLRQKVLGLDGVFRRIPNHRSLIDEELFFKFYSENHSILNNKGNNAHNTKERV